MRARARSRSNSLVVQSHHELWKLRPRPRANSLHVLTLGKSLSASLNRLPEELILLIIRHLDARTVFLGINLLNKRYHRLVKENAESLWRLFTFRRWSKIDLLSEAIPSPQDMPPMGPNYGRWHEGAERDLTAGYMNDFGYHPSHSGSPRTRPHNNRRRSSLASLPTPRPEKRSPRLPLHSTRDDSFGGSSTTVGILVDIADEEIYGGSQPTVGPSSVGSLSPSQSVTQNLSEATSISRVPSSIGELHFELSPIEQVLQHAFCPRDGSARSTKIWECTYREMHRVTQARYVTEAQDIKRASRNKRERRPREFGRDARLSHGSEEDIEARGEDSAGDRRRGTARGRSSTGQPLVTPPWLDILHGGDGPRVTGDSRPRCLAWLTRRSFLFNLTLAFSLSFLIVLIVCILAGLEPGLSIWLATGCGLLCGGSIGLALHAMRRPEDGGAPAYRVAGNTAVYA